MQLTSMGDAQTEMADWRNERKSVAVFNCFTVIRTDLTSKLNGAPIFVIYFLYLLHRSNNFVHYIWSRGQKKMASKERQMKGAHASNRGSYNLHRMTKTRENEKKQIKNGRISKTLVTTQAENNMDKWDAQPSQKFKGKLF